jgi:hypothetical protein
MWFKGEMNPNVYNNLGAPLNERFGKTVKPTQPRMVAQTFAIKSLLLFI